MAIQWDSPLHRLRGTPPHWKKTRFDQISFLVALQAHVTQCTIYRAGTMKEVKTPCFHVRHCIRTPFSTRNRFKINLNSSWKYTLRWDSAFLILKTLHYTRLRGTEPGVARQLSAPQNSDLLRVMHVGKEIEGMWVVFRDRRPRTPEVIK